MTNYNKKNSTCPINKVSKLIIFLLFNTLLYSSQAKEDKKKLSNNFVKKIEKAHKKNDFLSKKAVSFNFLLYFGGNERLNAKITVLTNSGKAKIELANGETILYDGANVYHSRGISEELTKKIRFNAYTWTYFFLFPYKLSDEGTKWRKYNIKHENKNNLTAKKLSFMPGIGDAPDDWYIVYKNSTNNNLAMASYIVTEFKDKKQAEKNPHAIQYLGYKEVSGIPLATEWKFWAWKAKKGLTKEIGSARLSNFQFHDNVDGVFEISKEFLKK